MPQGYMTSVSTRIVAHSRHSTEGEFLSILWPLTAHLQPRSARTRSLTQQGPQSTESERLKILWACPRHSGGCRQARSWTDGRAARAVPRPAAAPRPPAWRLCASRRALSAPLLRRGWRSESVPLSTRASRRDASAHRTSQIQAVSRRCQEASAGACVATTLSNSIGQRKQRWESL